MQRYTKSYQYLAILTILKSNYIVCFLNFRINLKDKNEQTIVISIQIVLLSKTINNNHTIFYSILQLRFCFTYLLFFVSNCTGKLVFYFKGMIQFLTKVNIEYTYIY